MWQFLRIVVFGILGGIIFGVLSLVGGYGTAMLLGEKGQALAFIVPMMIAPLAMLLGLVAGGLYAWLR